MSVAIIDYGAGNLRSVRGALKSLGADSEVVADPSDLTRFDLLILPGVGAFGEAIDRLRDAGWIEALRAAVGADGKRLLGVCLGMQLLAKTSAEYGRHEGLGFLEGDVVGLRDLGCDDRVPHVGWNALSLDQPEHAVFNGLKDGVDVYFVHSYALRTAAKSQVLASAEYGSRFPAVIGGGRVIGMQFHPEKSSTPGLTLLKNVLERWTC